MTCADDGFFLSYFTRILYYYVRLRVYTRETHYRRTLQQMQFVPIHWYIGTYVEAHDKTNIFLVRGRNHIFSGLVQKPHTRDVL